MASHINGRLDYKQLFLDLDFFLKQILKPETFHPPLVYFYNSFMGMMLCFMSVNFTRLHPQFGLDAVCVPFLSHL